MKRQFITIVLSIVFVTGFIGCSHTQTIKNDTGTTVVEVYYRDTGTTNWGNVKNARARRNSEGQYVLTSDGQRIYDRFNMNNGTQFVYFTDQSLSKTPKGTKNKDIRIVDSNGIIYTKLNVPIRFKSVNYFGGVINDSSPIVFTVQDRLPVLTMHNQTGFPIRIITPGTFSTANEDRAYWQLRELNQQNVSVSYSINDYTFTQNVNLNADVTLTLTERPPTIIVVNNTGYPVSVTRPFNQAIVDGERSLYPKQSRTANPLHSIIYRIGNAEYTEQVTLNNDDVTLTLTRRPPVVTIVNNVGVTINFIFLRTPGSPNWEGGNIVIRNGSVHLAATGTAQTGDISGSIVNRDNMRLWLGNIRLTGDRFDIRIDDVQGNTYVKSNVQITSDMTLTFTQSDKR